ncbi:hypothetical protein FHS96_005036 [Sphingomonas zeicaulis]
MDARRLTVRRIAIAAAAAGLGIAAWQGAVALQDDNGAAPVSTAANDAATAGNASVSAPPTVIEVKETPKPGDPKAPQATPMAQREAVIGFLNKRNGLSREVKLKPGQAVRIGDAVIRLRACEKTAPWEPEQLTGAFVQLDVHGSDDKWRRVFSGWLYKESPSLNMVQHPIYDVWSKSCTMSFPDAGPDTLVVRKGSGSASRAKKSGAAAADASPAPAPSPRAESSNDT